MDKQMDTPNNLLLPVRIAGRTYPTTEHYVLASLLRDRLHQDLVVSYPVDRVAAVFNYYDQEQYLRVVHEACNQFYEKKCRSVQYQGGKTVGSMARQLVRSHGSFLYKANPDTTPFASVVGLEERDSLLRGYNLIGISLARMKFLLEKVPEMPDPISEYIFWKAQPKDVPDPKTYKAILPQKTKKAKTTTSGNDTTTPFYEAEEDDDNDDEPEEQGFYPDEVPVYRKDRVRWVATSVNSRLDDMRDVGARADFLYATEAAPTDPFALPSETDLYSRAMDPLSVFKIYKAAEHLVGRMRHGYDIVQFQCKSVDAILLECRVSPELFAPRSLDPSQRHMIYVEYWQKFLSKAIPYYHLVEKEILYPQNLAGFIRKEYAMDLNERIGQAIREVLFSSFLYQVIETSYPQVAPGLRLLVLNRERGSFTPQEYEETTDRLYHLFFQDRFRMDQEGADRVRLLESGRLTTQQIEEALQFAPLRVVPAPSLDAHDTILDPMHRMDLTIDNRVFHDLFQFLYYRLYLFYGGLTQEEAYSLLQGLPGNDPRLSERLATLVQAQRQSLTRQALQAQYAQYPQVREAWLYARATQKPTALGGGQDLWDTVEPDPLDLRLMEWVVSLFPKKDKHHMDKSVRLYFFLHDMVRSMRIMKSVLGKRLQGPSLETFFRCFYHKLGTIVKKVRVSQKTPPKFLSYMEDTHTITGPSIHDLWKKIYPLVYLFQQEGFVPQSFFQKAKEEYPSANREDMAHALSRITQCLYQDKEAPNDHFYLLVQIMSGEDDILLWPDPSFSLMKEVEEDDQPSLRDLPEEVRKRLRRKPKKPKLEIAQHHILHPLWEKDHTLLQKTFDNPTMRSRASYALAALEKETNNPRRIVFYL